MKDEKVGVAINLFGCNLRCIPVWYMIIVSIKSKEYE